MDRCTGVLKAFPPGVPILDDDAYAKALKTHIANLGVLLRDGSQLILLRAEELLARLHSGVNSASYAAVLEAVIKAEPRATTNREILRNHLATFVLTYDPRQIRYLGASFRAILEHILIAKPFPAHRAVELVSDALQRIDPSGSVLTTLHTQLIPIAYQAGHVYPVLPIIEKQILYFAGDHVPIPTTNNLSDMTLPAHAYMSTATGLSGKLKPANVLEYDLLRGMMFLATRQWARAMDAFQHVITYPVSTNGVSKVMVEGFKKWALVSLIHHGMIKPLPVFTSKLAEKAYQSIGRPYLNLNDAFKSADVAKLRSEVERNTYAWAEDKNEGLMREVLAAYQKWQIINLRDIYSKISTREIREQTWSAETGQHLKTDAEVEALLHSMISSGMLAATVVTTDNHPPHVIFLSGADMLSEAEFARRVADGAQRVKDLGRVYKAANARLSRHKDYVAFMQREKKRQEKEDESVRDPFDTQVVDEDLMGGLVDPAA